MINPLPLLIVSVALACCCSRCYEVSRVTSHTQHTCYIVCVTSCVLQHTHALHAHRDWAGGNDPFILNAATDEHLSQAEHGVGPVNFVILEVQQPLPVGL